MTVFSVAHGEEGGWHPDLLQVTIFEAIMICLFMLPFWIAFSFLAGRLRLQHLILYMLAGAALGVYVGAFYLACIPQMVWDSGPTLDFVGRGLQTFHHSGAMFALTSVVACTCYWLLAIRRKQT